MNTTGKRNILLALAMSTMLAGCGGDGGGGVASAPASPSSPATPAGANTSLTGTLVSESFLNSSSFGAISVPLNGAAITTSAGTSSLTIAYNAANGTYTLNDGTRSLSVSASNIDKALTNTAVTTYVTTTGSTQDSLILANNGTGGGLTRYVGAGIWLREVDGTNTVDGRVNGFTYGVQTGASAIPRSGTASYDVNLLGIRSAGSAIYSLGGNGVLNVDFGSGAIYASGLYSEANSTTGGKSDNHSWASQALLASSGNSFLGQIQTDSAGSGEWHGALYGPTAQEVGGSWSSKSGSDVAAAGVIWGAQGGTALNGATSLASPQTDAFFTPVSASLSATATSANLTLSGIGAGAGLATIYRAKSGTQDVIYARDGRITLPSSTTGLLTYQQFNTDLLYSRAAVQFDARTSNLLVDAYAYGLDTPASAVPRTGTANYTLTLNGGVALTGQPLRGITGSGLLIANFAGNSLTTQGSYTLTDPKADSYTNFRYPLDRGSWTGSGTIASAGNSFAGTATFDSDTTADFSASLAGKFFGPAAQEVGGSFSGSASDGSRLAAAFTGTQDSTLAGALNGLASLTGVVVLPGNPAVLSGSSMAIGAELLTTWDTTERSYRFKSSFSGDSYAIDKTFLDSDRLAVQADAAYTAYHNGAGDMRVLNVGAANPLIALTYTSFAEITGTSGALNTPTAWYVPFGSPTPASQIPHTGSATYNGVVVGRGAGASVAAAADLSGTSTMALNFATFAATMNMALTATNRATGAVQAIGAVNWTGSMGNSSPSSSQNRLAAYTSTPGTSGSLVGMLYGTNAAEFGGAFNLQISNVGADQASSFSGAVVAKKAP
jgi:hypothetical protein